MQPSANPIDKAAVAAAITNETEWVAAGQTLQRTSTTTNWQKGDWLLLGRHRYGSKYRDACVILDEPLPAIRIYQRMAREFPPEARAPELSWASHLVILRGAPKRERHGFVVKAVELGAGDIQVRRILKEAGYLRSRTPRPIPVVDQFKTLWGGSTYAEKRQMLQFIEMSLRKSGTFKSEHARIANAADDALSAHQARQAIGDPDNQSRVPWDRVKRALGLRG